MSIPMRPPRWFWLAVAFLGLLALVNLFQWAYLTAKTLQPPVPVRPTPGLYDGKAAKLPLVRCKGLTKKQKPCGNMTRDPSGYCYLHHDQARKR